MESNKYPRQPEYTGNKMFSVSHHSHGTVDVYAKTRAGAIVTAAAVWGERWQSYKFYAWCDVTEHKKGKTAKEK